VVLAGERDLQGRATTQILLGAGPDVETVNTTDPPARRSSGGAARTETSWLFTLTVKTSSNAASS
jgi:hypothetical protein